MALCTAHIAWFNWIVANLKMRPPTMCTTKATVMTRSALRPLVEKVDAIKPHVQQTLKMARKLASTWVAIGIPVNLILRNSRFPLPVA